ncbi:MAG: hypothetical protein AAF614_38445 [Chloroflexota bacterium]
MDPEVVEAVLADWQTAVINPKLKTTLGYLEKLVLPDATVETTDIAAMHQAGVSRIGMEEATLIAFVYQTMSRLADGLDFNLTPEEHLASSGELLYKIGYSTSSLPG